MKLKPLADRVVLKQNAAEERTSSGIFLTASAQEKPEVYEVVEVGPGGMVDGNQVDTIVIAGMGGDTICGILDRAEWCMAREYTLILQPMTKCEILRYWLVYNEFEIISEELVRDDRLYQIITARFGGRQRLNDAELYTGSTALIGGDPLFPELRGKLERRFASAVDGMRESTETEIIDRRRLYEEILNQLRDMEGGR